MKKQHCLLCGVLMLLLAVAGIGCFLYGQARGRASDSARSSAESAAQTTETIVIKPVPEPETASEPPQYEPPVDFEALTLINPDTVGWIRIPDTNIDYPIVQTDNNDTYLHTDFKGKESIAGAIYLDFESDSNLMGFNNVLYGHNMKNGSMFKDVVKFKDKTYFEEHQYFEIYTPERIIRLKAISCYYAKADAIVRKTKFHSQESFDAFVADRFAPGTWGEIPQVPIDSLYVLVTCSYEVEDARTFLFAVEVDEEGEIRQRQ